MPSTKISRAQSGSKPENHIKRHLPAWPWWMLLAAVSVLTMACGLGQSASDAIVMRNHLPSLTRTPLPTLTPTVALAQPLAAAPVGATGGSIVQPAGAVGATGSISPEQPADPTGPETMVEPAGVAANPASVADSPPAVIANSNAAMDTAGQPAVGNVSNHVQQPQIHIVPTATPAAAPHLVVATGPQLIDAVPKPGPVVVAGAVRPFMTPTPRPTKIPMPAVNPTSTPAGQPAAEPTPTPDLRTAGWSFDATRVNDHADNGLRLVGEIINDTGSTQELYYISGTFFNDQGQIIAGHRDTADFVPVTIIPPGGRMPFELTVNNIDAAADFDLWARSVSNDDAPRESDFEFLDVTEQPGDDTYCLSGSLANRGDELDDYVDIVAILYNDDGDVLNFNDSYHTGVENFSGDETLPFEVCVELPADAVARYDLRAWGE